jgi:hypothetical protein
MGGRVELPYPAYKLESGRIEAASGGMGSVGAEPQRAYAEVWTWNGRVFTHAETVYEPPVYRYHPLLDGDRALRSGDYATAAQLYERVVQDDALQPFTGAMSQVEEAEERAILAAFARWPLLLTHVQMEGTTAAQIELNRLQADVASGATGDEIAELARTFWEAGLQAYIAPMSCADAVAAPERYPEVLAFLNNNYGYANPFWEARDLCPF